MEYESGKHTISFLYNHTNYTRYKLQQLIKKFVKWDNNFYQILSENSDDRIIRYMLQFKRMEKLNKPHDRLAKKKTGKRSNERANIVYDYLQSIDKQVNKYLDIGCSNGENTVAVKDKLKLGNAYGIDVDSFAGKKIVPLKGFTYKNYNGVNIPFKSNSFDLVTMFQVFHHVEKPVKLLKEIHRVLKPNGILFMREHNKINNVTSQLYYLEHLFYALFYDNTPYPIFIKNYYEHYYSKKNLKKLLTQNNFTYIKPNYKMQLKELSYKLGYNPTNFYHILFTSS